MLDTVDDHIFIVNKNNITVLSHNFNHQVFPAQIAHLIQMLNLDLDDSLQPWLGDSYDTPILNMFSEQHTEAGSCHRTLLIVFRQINQRQGSAGRDKKPLLSAVYFYREHQLIAFRLCYFINPPSEKAVIQFLYDTGDRYSVKCHNHILLILIDE